MTPLLEVRDLSVHFPIDQGFLRPKKPLKAVQKVNFSLGAGETLGVVGESGCGKTTLGRSILNLIKPTEGQIFFKGQDITQYNKKQWRALRSEMQIIFQDPYASLNPRLTIFETLLEPLKIHTSYSRKEARKIIEETIERVGLRTNALQRYPHEFSGGQRQRVGIARAIILKPKVVIADEAVSALDVSIQSQILNLIAELKRDLQISFIFISHDLAVIQHVADRVAVMYLGSIVENADVKTLYEEAKHPYTQMLLRAVPTVDKVGVDLFANSDDGEVPSPLNPPRGCAFHPRCPEATPECKKVIPKLISSGDNQTKCHLYN